MKMNGENVQYNIERVIDSLYFSKRILSNITGGICAHFLTGAALFPSTLNEGNSIFLVICKETRQLLIF